MSYGCVQVPQLSSSIATPFSNCRSEHGQKTTEIGSKIRNEDFVDANGKIVTKIWGPSASQYTAASVCPHVTARESFSGGLANISKSLMM
jgi:hypothetical protein